MREKKHTPMHRPGPGSSSRQQNQQRTARVPKPTPTPSGPSDTVSIPKYDKQISTASSSSIEEQQQKQMERLAGRMHTIEAIRNMEEMDENNHKALHGLGDGKKLESETQRAFRKQMKRQLTRNGLIEGIIMSEVLGAPQRQKAL
ncbi:hypothetical protein RWE15_23520 [Virgibacillus halophilus]|uniref:Uncharacterized protein n=1 Tax=Tigheibacillus halophilus TaxID=361280 RepID=A0ABU5CBL4_9BACI|nr:hypothetical protein [Virgibacillus halophilus]